MTRLAVLIPVYRNQSGLDRSLASLRDAKGSFDVVIVDDGSPDPISTPAQLREDVPVSLLRVKKNQGIAAALNHGLRDILSRGYSYVGRLDSGDTIVSERFERQVQLLDTDPNCAAVSSFVDYVDANHVTLFRYCAPSEHHEIVQRLHLNNCVMHPGSMLRASALQSLGVYREDVRGVEDYELFLRLSRRYTLAVIPEVLTYCEYSRGSLSIAGRRRLQRERLKLQLRYFDLASAHSFYGVARTLLAMMTPQSFVLWSKRTFLRRIARETYGVDS